VTRRSRCRPLPSGSGERPAVVAERVGRAPGGRCRPAEFPYGGQTTASPAADRPPACPSSPVASAKSGFRSGGRSANANRPSWFEPARAGRTARSGFRLLGVPGETPRHHIPGLEAVAAAVDQRAISWISALTNRTSVLALTGPCRRPPTHFPARSPASRAAGGPPPSASETVTLPLPEKPAHRSA
jgi:hypothetical protein